MFYQTETKLQGWRALAVFADRTECLIYVGRSTTQVRAGYAGAFAEILEAEERAQVRSISLQCWQGAADKGRWVPKGVLAVPGAAAKGQEPRTDPAVAPEAAVERSGARLPHRPAVLGFPGAAPADGDLAGVDEGCLTA